MWTKALEHDSPSVTHQQDVALVHAVERLRNRQPVAKITTISVENDDGVSRGRVLFDTV